MGWRVRNIENLCQVTTVPFLGPPTHIPEDEVCIINDRDRNSPNPPLPSPHHHNTNVINAASVSTIDKTRLTVGEHRGMMGLVVGSQAW